MSALGAAKFGMLAPQSATPFVAAPAATNGAVTPAGGHPPFLSAESPALWIVGIGALTFGFIAVSTSVRVGPLRFSAAAGH